MRLFPFPLSPEQGSAFAKDYDFLFLVITLLTVFFTVAVLGVVFYFSIKYRAGSPADRSNTKHEHLGVEIAWSLPPLMLGLLIFVWGAYMFIGLRRPPKNAIDIYVIGKQWMWHIQHPNGVREMNELHVPSGIPVKLTMISQDVIHAFYVPEFRVQYMVVPGRYTYEWFTPTRPGRYHLFCAQHCGTGHSEMGGYVYVMSQEDYAKWLANGGTMPSPGIQTMAQKGEAIYTRLGCANCHTGEDNERAPTLAGIYDKSIKMNNGTTKTADDEYLRTSLVSPYADIVAGYTNTMPAYTVGPNGDLSEEEIEELIEYMKSLSASQTAPSRTLNSAQVASGAITPASPIPALKPGTTTPPANKPGPPALRGLTPAGSHPGPKPTQVNFVEQVR